jgi:hypothetical protein
MADGDRILTNLPPLFNALPRPSTLTALADSFGGELLDAENSLAAMMFAHWVDTADLNTASLTDLSAIAALYGMQPRDDETIEGFRAHLKRTIRIYIEGPSTVRGLLRITADVLGIPIADTLDMWWDRAGGPDLRTRVADGDDAASLLFGIGTAAARGVDAAPASLSGTVDLSAPLDLRGRSILSVVVDGGPVVTADLATLLNPAAADVTALATAISGIAGITAEARDNRLRIATRSRGAASTLTLADGAGDVVPAVLGLAPLTYAGTDAIRARIVGTPEWPAALDLGARRYLRLAVDGTEYEVDLEGATNLSAVISAITTEAGPLVADAEGGRLVLSSPVLGLVGSITLGVATAADARALLLGDAATYARGQDAAPARVTGQVDLNAGVDLSRRSKLMLAIDAMAPQVINCAGQDPTHTLAGEIALAINAAVGQAVATQNGATLTLTSVQRGAAARIRLLSAGDGDALDLILGLASRTARGADPTTARLEGGAFPKGVDLSALRRVQIAIDEVAPVIVPLPSPSLDGSLTPIADVAAAINAATGTSAATAQGARLTLTASAPGAQGAVAMLPIERMAARRYVSRAFPADEASAHVVGATTIAHGAAATSGRLAGMVDLHDGLDLRGRRFLRLALDSGRARDIDCTAGSPRPRAVLLPALTQAITARLGGGFADIVGGRLVLRSATMGAASGVTVLPGAGDATEALFGAARTATGSAATRVTFIGLRDLSNGVDLGTANRVRLAIDGGAPVEIPCAGDVPAATAANEIVDRINRALGGAYASTDGRVLRLSSALSGSASAIAFLPPAQDDATRSIFGIGPGRTYRGDDPGAPVLASDALPATLDLAASPFIRLAADGAAGVLIDCHGADPTTTALADVAARINAALPAPAPFSAAIGAGRVVITGKTIGPQANLTLLPADDFDASAVLLGAAVPLPGQDATPAVVTGAIDLRQGVDLSQRSVIRLAINGGRAIDVDVAGASPGATFGDEITLALNRAVPGLARLDAAGHLVLIGPTPGPDGWLDLLPLRPLELIDYPAEPTALLVTLPGYGRFTLENDGAAETNVTLTLSAPNGFRGADLFNLTTGTRIHLDAVAQPGETLTVAVVEGNLTATLRRADGTNMTLPPPSVQAGPVVLTAVVPFAGERPLAAGAQGTRPALALIDPVAGSLVVIEARSVPPPVVSVTAAKPPSVSAPRAAQPAGPLTLVGQLRLLGGVADLLDADSAVLARLRAGAGVAFAPFAAATVLVAGTWYPTAPIPLLSVTSIARLFDIQLGPLPLSATAIDARAGAHSLAARLAALGDGSVMARDVNPSAALTVPPGPSAWLVLAFDAARFDFAHFDVDRFVGPPCAAPGVFNASRFAAAPLAPAIPDVEPRFAPFGGSAPVTVAASWQSHRPGRLAVNLPADLPARFGARFNAARFTSSADTGETLRGVVLEPKDSAQSLRTLLLAPKPGQPAASPLVNADTVDTVPLGWEAQAVPFTTPRQRFLSGGRADRPAAIYLHEPGVPYYAGIFANQPGAWGDEIAVSMRYAGPAIFDLTITYTGARFECARQIVFSGRVLGAGASALPPLAADIVSPAAVGIARAKAAGIAAEVTRDTT